jgi:hypothetical protein
MMVKLRLLLIVTFLSGCAATQYDRVDPFVGHDDIRILASTKSATSEALDPKTPLALIVSENTRKTIDSFQNIKDNSSVLGSVAFDPTIRSLKDVSDPRYYTSAIVDILKRRWPQVAYVTELKEARERGITQVAYIDFHCEHSGWTLDSTCTQTAYFFRTDAGLVQQINLSAYSKNSVTPWMARIESREKILTQFEQRLLASSG